MIGPETQKTSAKGPKYRPQYIADPDSLIVRHGDFENQEVLKNKALLHLRVAIKGQDNALEAIAQAACLHCNPAEQSGRKYVLAGPSSSGKKYAVAKAASALYLPIAIVSCGELDGADSVKTALEEAIASMLMDARAKYVNFRLVYDDLEEYKNARQALYRRKELQMRHDDLSEDELAHFKEITSCVEDACIDYAQKQGIIILDEIDRLANKKGEQEALAQQIGKISAKLRDDYSDTDKTVGFNASRNMIVMTGEFAGIEKTLDKIAGAGINPLLLANAQVIAFNTLSSQAYFDIMREQIVWLHGQMNNKELHPELEACGRIDFAPDCSAFLASIAEKQAIGARGAHKTAGDFLKAFKAYAQSQPVKSAVATITPQIIAASLSTDRSYSHCFNQNGDNG